MRYLSNVGFSVVFASLARDNIHDCVRRIGVEGEIEAEAFKVALSVRRLALENLMSLCQKKNVVETVEYLGSGLMDYRYYCDTEIGQRFKKLHER